MKTIGVTKHRSKNGTNGAFLFCFLLLKVWFESVVQCWVAYNLVLGCCRSRTSALLTAVRLLVHSACMRANESPIKADSTPGLDHDKFTPRAFPLSAVSCVHEVVLHSASNLALATT